MGDKFWFYLIFSISFRAVVCNSAENAYKQNKYLDYRRHLNDKCWNAFGAQELSTSLERIDKEYAHALDDSQSYLDKTNFTNRILKEISVDNDIILRAAEAKSIKYHGKIPSDTILGGLCIMTLTRSVLFFHRMKLRNHTFFHIKNLDNDVKNMVLKGQILLKDLHLIGPYDSSLYVNSTSENILKHIVSYGELQVFMEQVHYAIECRYILKKENFFIEVIMSTLDTKDITLTHTMANKSDSPILLDSEGMGDFMIRLKSDLDKWMQDYLNHYLSVISLKDIPSISMLGKYYQQKNMLLDMFVDNALNKLTQKLSTVGGDTVHISDFNITTSRDWNIHLFAGNLQGLETMYRQSKATTILKDKKLRTVDSIISFWDLRIIYAYKVTMLRSSAWQTPPTYTGLLTMTAKQQTARLTLKILSEREPLQLDIDFLNRLGADSIDIKGISSIIMSNFKHILNNEIAIIMSNSLIHSRKLLESLPQCESLPRVIPILKIEQHQSNKLERMQLKIGINELKTTPKMIPKLTRQYINLHVLKKHSLFPKSSTSLNQ